MGKSQPFHEQDIKIMPPSRKSRQNYKFSMNRLLKSLRFHERSNSKYDSFMKKLSKGTPLHEARIRSITMPCKSY